MHDDDDPVSNLGVDHRLVMCMCAVCALTMVMFYANRRGCLYQFLVGVLLINN
jgi:hypothetical protein